MAAIPPVNILGVHQPDKGFVHQGRGLESMTRPFAAEAATRNLAQVGHEQFEQRRLGARISRAEIDVGDEVKLADVLVRIQLLGPDGAELGIDGEGRFLSLLAAEAERARQLRRRIGAIAGVVDTHLQQEVDAPAFFAAIDRTRAGELGLNASQIATNLNISLSSSEQVTPNFWTDPTKGIPYYLVVQTPEPRVASLNSLTNTPVSTSLSPQGDPVPGLLSNVATLTRTALPTNANQENIQPVYDVYASLQGRALGSVAADIDAVVTDLKKELKPGNTIQVVGQIQSMNDSFRNLGLGLLFAAVLVYLLMVVNYQNFGDPFG